MRFSYLPYFLVIAMLFKVRFASFRIWLHGSISRFPASRANFSMFVSKLESLYQSKCLIHRPPYWQIIDSDLSQISLIIDDKQTSKCQTYKAKYWLQQTHRYTKMVFTLAIVTPFYCYDTLLYGNQI